MSGAERGLEMETISRRLKDTLRKGMREGRTYSNKAIRQLISDETGMKYGEDYQESHFAGCLNALRKSGDIIQVQRGEYIKGNTGTQSPDRALLEPKTQDSSAAASHNVMTMAQVKENILQSVQRELAYLKSITQNLVLSFDTSEEDIQCMLKLKELVKNLEEFERQMDV